MTNHDSACTKTHLTISSVALIFCLIWVFIGEADIKILAVTVSFIYFLKAGIDTEMCSIAAHGDGH